MATNPNIRQIEDGVVAPTASPAAGQVLTATGTGQETQWTDADQVNGRITFSGGWFVSTVTAIADPGSGFIRTNDTLGATTEIAISASTDAGVDASLLLPTLTEGDLIYLQEAANPDLWAKYQLTADITDNTTWFQASVEFIQDTGFNKGEDAFVRFAYSGDGVNSVIAGSGIDVDSTDPNAPIVSVTALAITDTFVVADEPAMLALNAQVGDVAVRTDISTTFILQAEPASTLGNWIQLESPGQDLLPLNNTWTGTNNFEDTITVKSYPGVGTVGSLNVERADGDGTGNHLLVLNAPDLTSGALVFDFAKNTTTSGNVSLRLFDGVDEFRTVFVASKEDGTYVLSSGGVLPGGSTPGPGNFTAEGFGRFGGNVEVLNDQPSLYLEETDAPANEGNWLLEVLGNEFIIKTLLDNGSDKEIAMIANRSGGGGIESVEFPTGTVVADLDASSTATDFGGTPRRVGWVPARATDVITSSDVLPEHINNTTRLITDAITLTLPDTGFNDGDIARYVTHIAGGGSISVVEGGTTLLRWPQGGVMQNGNRTVAQGSDFTLTYYISGGTTLVYITGNGIS